MEGGIPKLTNHSFGRWISRDPIGESGGINLYSYVENEPLNNVDPLGLYELKPGVPSPSPQIDKLLISIEKNTGEKIVVTSTSEIIPAHPPGSPHANGDAVDIRYPDDPDATMKAASDNGAGFGLDEKKHPSKNATAPHIHIQIPSGKNGGRGDLPKPGKECK